MIKSGKKCDMILELTDYMYGLSHSALSYDLLKIVYAVCD